MLRGQVAFKGNKRFNRGAMCGPSLPCIALNFTQFLSRDRICRLECDIYIGEPDNKNIRAQRAGTSLTETLTLDIGVH